MMKSSRSQDGFTVLEMMAAVAMISILGVIYVFMVDSYQDRRSSELAAKVLMQAARVQEEFFAKEHRYFDAEISGAGREMFLTTPDGAMTSVRVPSKVVLTMKAEGKNKREFTGSAFFSSAKVMHRYESKTGKMTTVARIQDQKG